MPKDKQKYYLTTPIYYVNARPHIGHAYTTIVADVVARRRRLLGDEVWFLTGTDEHGQKIERAAKAANTSPQEFADQVSAQFEGLWKRMGITNDQYIRTTDEAHKRGVQKLFSTLRDKGFIYKDSYTGAYCVSDEAFVDAPVGTPCPDCGRALEEVTEENFFFVLSTFQERLIDLIVSEELLVEPFARRNEVLSFLAGDYSLFMREYFELHPEELKTPSETTKAAEWCISTGRTKRSREGFMYVPGVLRDLSISRSSFSWGVPVPGDDKHVIYVWLDALANYITALGYGSEDESNFKKFWPADLHLVGKEIIRFHCVYWPAFLMAAGLPLPKKIVAHGWLLFEESKMSKSRGNIVRTETILDAFGSLKPEASKAEQDLFGADVLRYFLLREISFGSDGSFSFDALLRRYNSDLVNGYGNLVSRTLTMIQKYCDGKIPHFAPDVHDEFHPDILSITTNEQFARLFMYLDELAFDDALRELWSLLKWVDTFLTKNAPWKEPEGLTPEQIDGFRRRILYVAADLLRVITALAYPILPETTAKVWQQLGLGNIEVAAQNGEFEKLKLGWGTLKADTPLGTLGPIFPRADKELINRMNEMEQNNSPAAEPVAAAPIAAATPENVAITIDDFMKVELRVAQIKVAERIPKADKLLRLEVDLGTETRQILSGIAEHYTPEELIGRRVIIVANLAPRKMRGLESHGMLLAASLGDADKPVLATVPDDAVLGSRVR